MKIENKIKTLMLGLFLTGSMLWSAADTTGQQPEEEPEQQVQGGSKADSDVVDSSTTPKATVQNPVINIQVIDRNGKMTDEIESWNLFGTDSPIVAGVPSGIYKTNDNNEMKLFKTGNKLKLGNPQCTEEFIIAGTRLADFKRQQDNNFKKEGIKPILLKTKDIQLCIEAIKQYMNSTRMFQKVQETKKYETTVQNRRKRNETVTKISKGSTLSIKTDETFSFGEDMALKANFLWFRIVNETSSPIRLKKAAICIIADYINLGLGTKTNNNADKKVLNDFCLVCYSESPGNKLTDAVSAVKPLLGLEAEDQKLLNVQFP